MNFMKKCLVDTNVPIIANLATRPDPKSDVPDACVLTCIKAVEHVIKKGGLVIDAGDEIFSEYIKNLPMKGHPGVGSSFMKWVNDNRYNPEYADRVNITKNGESYDEFPVHDGLANFDISDRKFVAAANAHRDKPPILQAADGKWLAWKDALAEVGITVHFLCPEYAEAKCAKKIRT